MPIVWGRKSAVPRPPIAILKAGKARAGVPIWSARPWPRPPRLPATLSISENWINQMEKFTDLTGMVAPIDRANVDTDVIIPGQFLKSIKRTGFGPNLFDGWRYLDHGEPDRDNSNRPLNPEFVLNQPRYRGARILLARDNFGCGSSREHAPWALADFGFRALIAPSFADIFYNNCLKNGLLPVVLTDAEVSELTRRAREIESYQITVDLEKKTVSDAHGFSAAFEIGDFQRYCLLEGLDEIGLTLKHEPEITAYENRRPPGIR